MGEHDSEGEAFRLALFRALVEGVETFVSCIDRERQILFLNRTLSRPMSEIVGHSMDGFVLPEQRARTIACVEQAFSSGKAETLEYPVLLSDGARRYIRTRVLPFKGARGEDLALLLTDDITEQRRLTEELERSVEFRRRVVEHLPDFVTLLDREQRFVWVNRLAPGLTLDDVIGQKVDVFTGPETLAKAQSTIQAAFESGAVGVYEAEAYGDGKNRAWFLVRVVPIIVDGKVENALLISSDITEHKRAEQALRETEEQLHRAQRQESLGQLAGGIAHDFNNLLQVIQSNISFAQSSLAKGGSVDDELEQALRATERAAELTTRLLAIGRRQRVDPKRVDLGSLVAQSVRMLRRAIPENIVLSYEPPAESYYVDLDAPQFEQVLINLCVNARDAMPHGGTLTIRLEPEGATHVVMSVIDTGTGIAQEHLARVFEPFFTTKGAGSGLGLAVAAGIVAAHGGQIVAESDGRSGTTMRVRLPRAEPEPAQPPAPPRQVAGGTGVILIAEDEDIVRAQLVRTLASAGYTVLEARDGARAVELARGFPGKLELAVLDVVMPGLDGWQTYLQLEQMRPGIKVLFTTGYAANVLPGNFAARGARLLCKPYKPQQVLAQVRDLLDQAALSRP